MKHSPLSAAPALILVALLAATGAAAAPDANGPAADRKTEAVTRQAPTLEGNAWLLAAYRDGEALAEVGAAAPPGKFRFAAGHLTGSAGCNQLGGAYTLAGDKLTFKPNLRMTMMACPEPVMKQEQAVSVALTRVAAWRLDGDLLEFLDTAGKPLLRFLPVTPAPLVGQVWRLSGYANGKQAMVSAVNGTEVSLEFRDDGTLGGSDGCNRYMSGYTLTGATLTIGPLASTRMACNGPAGAPEQARDYAAALGTVAGYRIDGGELTLLTGAGKPAARYRAQGVRPGGTVSASPPGVDGPAAVPPPQTVTSPTPDAGRQGRGGSSQGSSQGSSPGNTGTAP